ncbi:hypothetical protein KKB55_22750 [Myxococcota bacterium]|nr:hypothetical protein [Myxococcota bacterium]MBU1900575.1 hypothetical protein [Myxococcota bacterium]
MRVHLQRSASPQARAAPIKLGALLLGASLVLSCGDDSATEAKASAGYDDWGDAGASGEWGDCVYDEDCPTGYVCFRSACVYQGEVGGAGGVEAPDGAEVEIEARLSAGVVSGEDVFLASPHTDALIRIASNDLSLEMIAVGDRPTQVAPIEGGVVVLNEGSDALSFMRGSTLTFLDLQRHFNALRVSPDGRYALTFFDLTARVEGEDASALQEVAVVDVTASALTALVVVGFAPSEILFRQGEAIVITEDGLARIDLAAPPDVAPLVPLATDPTRHKDREIYLSADGAYAISRGPGEPGVTVVGLEEAQPRFVDLGATPTDLDMLPDGQSALVMLREAQRLAFVDLAEPEPEFVDFTGRILGSAAVGREVAVLYSTQISEAPMLALLDLVARRMIFQPVRRPVSGALLRAGAGETAILLHPDRDEGDPLDGAAYSLLNLRDGISRLQIAPGAPVGVALEATAALLFFREGRGGAVHFVDLEGFRVRRFELPDVPESGGFLPDDGGAFVSQIHPEGRLSFLSLVDGGVRTVGGFALNRRVR